MYLSAWIVGFIIPAALMLISYFIHGCIYYNDKLDYIVDHEKPSYIKNDDSAVDRIYVHHDYWNDSME